MTTSGAGGLLKDHAGRVRLGWRLLAFIGLTAALTLLAAAVLPVHMISVSAAMLFGSTLAGFSVLAWDGRTPGALGFHLDRSTPRELVLGMGLGIAVGLSVVLAIFALGGVSWTAQEGDLVAWLRAGAGAGAFLLLPAAAEEALVRGYPLQAMAEGWGPLTGLAATSLIFGGLHAWNPGVTPLALANVAAAGVLLGVVYLKTGSLWWATGAHLGWNWAHGFLVDVPVSGLELLDAPFYEGVASGPTWVGGGAFGPEGSLVATVVLALASVALWRTDLLKPVPATRITEPLIDFEGMDQRPA